MSTTLALEKLFNDVTAAMPDVVHNYFGWREVARQQVDQHRIVWVPQGGATDAAIDPGRVPRPLATLYEECTCYISAFDPTDIENELAQYKATRLLLDSWYSHCYRAVRGTFQVTGLTWNTSHMERRHGCCLEVTFTVQSMLPDLVDQLELFDFPVTFDADVVELDVTESGTVGTPVVVVAATAAPATLDGEQIVDGVTVADGDMVLVKDGPDTFGTYVVNDVGPWVFVEAATYVGVLGGGTTNGGKGFQLVDGEYVLLGPSPVTEDL
jgi:hypothetical protein